VPLAESQDRYVKAPTPQNIYDTVPSGPSPQNLYDTVPAEDPFNPQTLAGVTFEHLDDDSF